MTDVRTQAPRGLEGLIVADTAVGEVRGREGLVHYRGHDATWLARHHSFEEVWHLVVAGHLPNREELAAWRADIADARRALPGPVLDGLRVTDEGIDRTAALRTAWSRAATELGCRPWDELAPHRRQQEAVAVTALGPVLVGAIHTDGVAAELDRLPAGTAAAHLRLVTGQKPTEQQVSALERYLVLTIDHGLNASTFTARTVASTGADLGAVLVAALGALSGPLHGGAPSRVLDMLDAIDTPEQARAWVDAALARGERIPGFGHRIYRTEDPRARLLRETAVELGGPTIELALHVERVVTDRLADRSPERRLAVNVEFYAAVVLDAVGLPASLFTPTFAVSRSVGWSAHALEQAQGNRIVRPSARYVGPDPVDHEAVTIDG